MAAGPAARGIELCAGFERGLEAFRIRRSDQGRDQVHRIVDEEAIWRAVFIALHTAAFRIGRVLRDPGGSERRGVHDHGVAV